jgi:hypothetical protein
MIWTSGRTMTVSLMTTTNSTRSAGRVTEPGAMPPVESAALATGRAERPPKTMTKETTNDEDKTP